jgi:hypothetical protein
MKTATRHSNVTLPFLCSSTARVVSFAPFSFNVSHSQSQLRVATTAAFISAHEIQHAWDSDFDQLPEVSHEENTL